MANGFTLPESRIKGRYTNTGLAFGPVTVELVSSREDGSVFLTVETSRGVLHIQSAANGYMKVRADNLDLLAMHEPTSA